MTEKQKAPRGIDGESAAVAERSGSDTETPDRPIPRDLSGDEPQEKTEQAERDQDARPPDADDTVSDMPEPESEVGPAS